MDSISQLPPTPFQLQQKRLFSAGSNGNAEANDDTPPNRDKPSPDVLNDADIRWLVQGGDLSNSQLDYVSHGSLGSLGAQGRELEQFVPGPTKLSVTTPFTFDVESDHSLSSTSLTSLPFSFAEYSHDTDFMPYIDYNKHISDAHSVLSAMVCTDCGVLRCFPIIILTPTLVRHSNLLSIFVCL